MTNNFDPAGAIKPERGLIGNVVDAETVFGYAKMTKPIPWRQGCMVLTRCNGELTAEFLQYLPS